MFNKLNEEQEKLRDFDRVNGLKSTFYLGKVILGYDLFEQPHRGVCNFLDELETRKAELLIDPRGSYKTSLVSQVYPARRIINNPNIRILLDSVALTNSQHNLQVIRRMFEGNAGVREIWGDYVAKDRVWNDTEFTVSRRTDQKLKEATVTASGIDKIQIGPHYDLIILDDIHNKDNYKSLEQLEKVKEHVRLLFGLLEPTGEMLIAGHRWSYTDVYSMVMGETDKPDELKFAERFRGNVFKHSAVYPDGSLYFPARLDYAHLDKQRASLGTELYSAMLLNEPALTGPEQKFDPRFFKRYKEPLQRKCEVTKAWQPKMTWYLRVDPGGKKKGNNYWVLFEGAIDASGNWHFVRYLKRVSKSTLAAEDIYRWYQQRKADGTPYKNIGCETSGQQGQMLQSMKDYLWQKYQVQLPWVELQHSDDSKESRIEALAPYYENGKIFHSEQMSAPFGLEDQLVKLTKSEDDVADAASMLLEETRPPRVIVEEPEAKNLDEKIQRRLRDRFNGKTQITREIPAVGSEY